jgi:hypothetical protein
MDYPRGELLKEIEAAKTGPKVKGEVPVFSDITNSLAI